MVSSRDKPGKGVWSEEQEEELRRLYMENQSNPQTDQGKTRKHKLHRITKTHS